MQDITEYSKVGGERLSKNKQKIKGPKVLF